MASKWLCLSNIDILPGVQNPRHKPAQHRWILTGQLRHIRLMACFNLISVLELGWSAPCCSVLSTSLLHARSMSPPFQHLSLSFSFSACTAPGTAQHSMTPQHSDPPTRASTGRASAARTFTNRARQSSGRLSRSIMGRGCTKELRLVWRYRKQDPGQ